MKLIKFNSVLLGAALLASSGVAQTTLPGGSDVDGSFAVGNSTNSGGLTVTGQTGNSASPGINVTGDGGVLFTGTLGVGSIPASGSGTRFMWYPGKGALRVGVMDSENANFIGSGSTAFSGSSASGHNSIAMNTAHAGGNNSIAMSGGYTFGNNSTAMVGATTYEGYSVAMTYGVTWGLYATAMGFASADGYASTAMSGGYAVGEFSTAMGNGAVSLAYNCVVIGQYNMPTGEEYSSLWKPSDPLFVIGNGTGVSTDPPDIRYNNVLTVYKSGKVQVNGDMILTKRQGDILMGEFGNPE